MRKSIIALITTFVFVPTVYASGPGERTGHFKGEAAETLVEAVQNFSEYNTRLEAILNGKVGDAEMAEVHQLTYTLENALAKINDELSELAEKLEALHVASEKLDRDGVVGHGRDYLAVSRQVVR